MQFFQDAFKPEGRRRHVTTSTGGRSGYTAENLRVVTKTLFRVMKITAFLLLVCCMQVSATGISQTVTYSGKDVSLTEIFDVIEKQTGYLVVASKKQVDKAKPVTVDAKDLPLPDFLQLALAEQPFTFTMEDRTISIKMKPVVNLTPQYGLESPPVSGIIRDANGNPLQGVNVVVKGTKRGITTDAQGKFSIDAKENDVLVISSIGFGKKEVRVTSSQQVVVSLEIAASPLDEVQYIAYGTTSRRLSTSNTATITAKEIETQPINNPLLALQGRVPGVTVMQANGIAGGGITIRIQGRNNLDNAVAGSDPFLVVDGIPYPSQNLSSFRGGSQPFPILGSSSDDGGGSTVSFGNPLAFVNPNDIESVTILKDADATAIYGSRAANGAILITTKKGKSGKMKADINLQHGRGQVPVKIDLMNSEQYMQMRWEAKRNDGRSVNSTDFDLRGIWDTTRYTDWQNVLIGGSSEYSRLTAGVSGGSDNLQYLVSTTYSRETSVFPGNFANTFASLNFNISTSSINQRFKFQLGGSYVVNRNKLPAEDYTSYALNLPPVAPALFNSDGTLNWEPDSITGNSTWFNPLYKQYNLFEIKTNNLVSNGSINYRILPGLELKSTFGFTSLTSDQFIARLDESERPERRVSRNRNATFSFNTSRSWMVEPQIQFQRKLSYHNIGVLVGTTFQRQNNDGRSFVAFGQTTDLLLRYMLAGNELAPNDMDVNEYKYNAIFGRVTYNFREKYLVSLSARRDGSSRFGPKSQFNNFGSLGVGWIISEEPFFKRNFSYVSFAKIRGSYGTTGNDQIDDYLFMNLYFPFTSGIPFQGVGGASPIGLPNPYLEWEETRKLQAGIDFGFWKDRLILGVTHIRNRTSNCLTVVNMPLMTGFNQSVTNLPALIQNTGWEFSIVSSNKKTTNFQWNSNFNLTIPCNKLLAFPGLETSPLNARMTVGQPLGTSKSVSFYAIDPLTGTYLSNTKSGDLTTNPGLKDATAFLKNGPRWYGGLQNSVSFRGFSVDFLIQFTRQYGLDLIRLANVPGRLLTQSYGLIEGNQPAFLMDRWQKPGDISNYARFTTIGGLGAEGDVAYKDISFVRLKNISLSYQFSKSLLQEFNLQQLQIYANAQNVLTFTSYKGLDPETRSINSLPPLRLITVGIKATF